MSSGVLQLLAVLSGVVAAVATVAAVLWAVWTYKRNAASQVQLLALGALQHYLDLAVTYPDLASPDDSRPVDARYAWFAAHALVTAQTLWTLVGRDPTWLRSVDSIIRQHGPYLRSGALVCGDFSPEFLAYLRSRVPGLRCADAACGCQGDR